MDSHRRIEQTAADWLVRQSDSDRPWTEADQAALDAWLSASAAHQVAYIRLKTVWKGADRLKALGAGLERGVVPDKYVWWRSPFSRHQSPAKSSSTPPPASMSGWEPGLRESHLEPRHQRQARRPQLRMAGVAASLLLVAALSLGGWQWYFGATDPVEFSTVLGTTKEIALGDGSHATLSSDTQLQASFSRRERRIELLRGEAHFDVAKDASRPFVVWVGDSHVTAVGTGFAVRSEAESDREQLVRLVVTQGIVRLGFNTEEPPSVPSAQLAAGSVATIRDGAVQIESRSVEQVEQMLAWRNGDVLFSGTALAEAVAELNRYNKRKIVIDDPDLAQMRVDGSFRITNVDGFVRLLERAFAVRVERRGDEVVLRSR